MRVFFELGGEGFGIGCNQQESVLRAADCIYEIAECNFSEIAEDIVGGLLNREGGGGTAALAGSQFDIIDFNFSWLSKDFQTAPPC